MHAFCAQRKIRVRFPITPSAWNDKLDNKRKKDGKEKYVWYRKRWVCGLSVDELLRGPRTIQ